MQMEIYGEPQLDPGYIINVGVQTVILSYYINC